jgi:succinoglycan biosynthesis protein ExoM
MRIAICVVTYRRPVMLAACLDSLTQLALDPSADVTTIVVDNDLEGGSRNVVTSRAAMFPWTLVYAIEAQRGISYARNHAVRLACAWGADFVAFLDDDETADPNWLRELLAVQQQLGAEVVTGPIIPRFDPGVPDWVVQGRFFERPRYATGTDLPAAPTANCLIAAALFSGSSTPFDPRFALTGGGDTHFFQRARRQGATIVWADRAIVSERVPPTRASVRWLLQRAYRGGASFVTAERMNRKSVAGLVLRLATGTARSALGFALLIPSLLLGKAAMVRALQFAFVGVGLIGGLCGLLYREYSVVHGE